MLTKTSSTVTAVAAGGDVIRFAELYHQVKFPQAVAGWLFVDEFCWRNTANGVPGGWPNPICLECAGITVGRISRRYAPIGLFPSADDPT